MPARYTTDAKVRSALSVPAAADDAAYSSTGTRSELITQAVEAAETVIDEFCGQPFTVASSQPSSRVFYAENPEYLSTDLFAGSPTSVQAGRAGACRLASLVSRIVHEGRARRQTDGAVGLARACNGVGSVGMACRACAGRPSLDLAGCPPVRTAGVSAWY